MSTQEDWIKPEKYRLPKGKFLVTSLVQDALGTKINLGNEEFVVEIFFDGIPVLLRSTVEGLRIHTWEDVQLKYEDRFYFRENFFYEVKNSKLVKWCVEESYGCFGDSELRHYCIVTSEEFIDIVSTFEPMIKVVSVLR